jgi:hypothetical protein
VRGDRPDARVTRKCCPMDADRFDAVARSLSTALSSRRSALAGFLAALAFNPGVAAKRHRRKGRHDHAERDAQPDESGRVGAEKKKRKHHKPKPKPAPCTASCAGKTCGTDGCSGTCGSCTTPQTCGGGGIPGACGGGSAPKCNTSQDCRDPSNMECRHDLGSICVCREATFDCGSGPCWPCCATSDCAARNRTAEAGFVCDTTVHDCVCLDKNETACPDGSNDNGTIYRCINLSSDADCGVQCNSREACVGGRHCINHACQLPGA